MGLPPTLWATFAAFVLSCRVAYHCRLLGCRWTMERHDEHYNHFGFPCTLLPEISLLGRARLGVKSQATVVGDPTAHRRTLPSSGTAALFHESRRDLHVDGHLSTILQSPYAFTYAAEPKAAGDTGGTSKSKSNMLAAAESKEGMARRRRRDQARPGQAKPT